MKNATFNYGQKIPTSDFCYIDVGSINNQECALSNKETILSSLNAPVRARKVVKTGCVLYSTVRPYLQNICMINKVFSKEPIASTAFAVLATESFLVNEYLYYYLQSPSFSVNVKNKMIGVAYPAISESELGNSMIALPPYNEQLRIIAKLHEIASH